MTKTGICKSCGYVGDTHLHHIVPRSKGGADKGDNLIEVCENCHNKIHDLSFKGHHGIIKKSLVKKKKVENSCYDFIFSNENNIEEIINDFAYEYKSMIVADMLLYGILLCADLLFCIKFGKPYKNGKSLDEVPKMLCTLCKNNNYKLDLDF